MFAAKAACVQDLTKNGTDLALPSSHVSGRERVEIIETSNGVTCLVKEWIQSAFRLHFSFLCY